MVGMTSQQLPEVDLTGVPVPNPVTVAAVVRDLVALLHECLAGIADSQCQHRDISQLPHHDLPRFPAQRFARFAGQALFDVDHNHEVGPEGTPRLEEIETRPRDVVGDKIQHPVETAHPIGQEELQVFPVTGQRGIDAGGVP